MVKKKKGGAAARSRKNSKGGTPVPERGAAGGAIR